MSGFNGRLRQRILPGGPCRVRCVGFALVGSLAGLGSGIWLLMLGIAAARAEPPSEFDRARARMVEEDVKGAGVKDPRVIRAMLATPRHEFVAADLRERAYLDMALPIGCQQTISSPFIVAFMTQCLDPQPADKVLEIGTGSGYQAAVLSHLVREVYTIEIEEPLGKSAERLFQRLGYRNVFSRIGDGFLGWPEQAPFDKIIVTCSPEKPPQPLLEQLQEGGLMVIPVGERYQQTLYLFRKRNGQLRSEAKAPTLFVPMTGLAEDQRQVRPDDARPEARNGNFEEPPGEDGDVRGWYYQRQCQWETHAGAPEGRHFVTFGNDQPGRSAHLLQGFPVNGSRVAEVEVSAWIRCQFVRNPVGGDFAAVAVTFYDENRKDLGVHWIGPFQGTFPWKQVRKQFRVPPEAREGILRIGLFGATGLLSVDDVRLKVVPP